jgi:hypothetical protein
MEPSKQIKAVAQTYLQEQQLREQAEYIAVLENTIITIANEIGVEPQQLVGIQEGMLGNLIQKVKGMFKPKPMESPSATYDRAMAAHRASPEMRAQEARDKKETAEAGERAAGEKARQESMAIRASSGPKFRGHDKAGWF